MSILHRCGYVAIAGRPNAGKSTLLNALVGEKIAIVADKPQTTRTSVQGVLTTAEAQVIFVDMPGIHRSDTMINRRMMQTVRAAVEGRDLVLYLHDATAPFTEEDQQAVDVLKKADAPAFLLLNKIDKVDDKRLLLPLMEKYREAGAFEEFLPVSAATGEGLEELKKLILARLPEGEAIFPPDYLTDQPLRFIAAELIRERVLHRTRQEVPHAVAVVVEKWEDKPNLTRIAATIYVERAGQKKILIGAGGAKIKQIGIESRTAIEGWTGNQVYLELFVKVRDNWRESAEFLNELDWRQTIPSEEPE
ncbi:MAG: GTPase Era [Bryobacter sp.]|nr:GTPase Era [Bryobacter sp.]